MKARSIKEILSHIIKENNLDEINQTINIEEAWKKIVGGVISKNTEIVQFKRGNLFIKTSTPVWRNELSLQKKELLEKINNKEPKFNIKEIIFK